MDWFGYLKVIIVGIVEGITEWLPISSTGHMILTEKFLPLGMTKEFMNMFNVVIQLGAILAVVVIFFHKLNPFAPSKTKEEKTETWQIWGKVIIGCLPAAVAGLLLDDWLDEHVFGEHAELIIACTLIFYGILFVIMETVNRGREFKIQSFKDMKWTIALAIGLIQVLALVPGTSRSGVTILGAMLLGCSRFISAEYTFYLAIPIMAGAGGLKFLKYFLDGLTLSGTEITVLVLGSVVAFVVSLVVIKFFMGYVKKKTFEFFGYYRIVLGAVILGIMYSSAFAGIF